MKIEDTQKIEDDYTDYKIGETISTVCDHYYVLDGYNGDLKSCVCNRCPSGVQVSKDVKLVKGKLIFPNQE